MLHRAGLFAVPTSVTLLCCLGVSPTQLRITPIWRPSQVTEAPAIQPEQPVVVTRELPRLVAVDGRVARRVNDLRPCVKARLARVVKKLPKRVTLLVTSAHRTHDEQASLVPTFGIKARPGTSTHEDGRAVDLNVFIDGERIRPRKQHKVIGKAMLSEGFRYLGPRDPVHYSIPKEKLDKTAENAELEVATWDEMNEIKEEIAAAEQGVTPASAAQPVATASATVSAPALP